MTDEEIEKLITDIVRAIDETPPYHWSSWNSFYGNVVYHKENETSRKKRSVREAVREFLHNTSQNRLRDNKSPDQKDVQHHS